MNEDPDGINPIADVADLLESGEHDVPMTDDQNETGLLVSASYGVDRTSRRFGTPDTWFLAGLSKKATVKLILQIDV
jgi:hypothetical protein